MTAKEFTIAYEVVSSLSKRKAKEKLSVLKRYLLPFEKEIPKDFFRELFVSTFGISERDLSLIENEGAFFIYLYNLTLRKAKGEELVKDEVKEYAFCKQYEDLFQNFPYVNIDGYDEEVVRFFSLRHKEMIEEMAENEGLKDKLSKCRGRPRLGKKGKYLTVKCYFEHKKDTAIASGTEDYILPFYALAVAYYYARNS